MKSIGTNVSSYVCHILHNGQPNHNGVCKIPKWWFQICHLKLVTQNIFYIKQISFKEIMIGNAVSGKSYKLGDTYFIWKCCWNIISTSYCILYFDCFDCFDWIALMILLRVLIAHLLAWYFRCVLSAFKHCRFQISFIHVRSDSWDINSNFRI